jgi:acyl-CoA thioesterase-1
MIMEKKKIILLALMILLFISCSKNEIRVAVVGDSITEGYGLSNQSKDAYPVMLDSILGSDYSVLNCGRTSTTMQKKGDVPYWNCSEFYNVFAFKPDIIIMKLGTNDIRPRMDDSNVNNWNAVNFSKDYQAMIDTFNTIYSKPKIFLCFPTPINKNIYNWNDGDSALRASVIPAIQKIGEVNNLPIIDLYTQMTNQPENFLDGIHPNEKGTRIMAEYIAEAIKGDK